MRSTTNAEQAFITQLVENTRQLVANQSVGLDGKLAAIQQAVRQNSQKLISLREARAQSEEPERIRNIERFISLRERATGYLVATAKFLVHREKHGATLRQRPRMFAYPDFDHGRSEAGNERAIPFMEFSS